MFQLLGVPGTQAPRPSPSSPPETSPSRQLKLSFCHSFSPIIIPQFQPCKYKTSKTSQYLLDNKVLIHPILYPAKISAKQKIPKHIHRQSKYNPSLIESSSRVQPESSSQYQQRHNPYNQFQWHYRTISSEQCDLE